MVKIRDVISFLFVKSFSLLYNLSGIPILPVSLWEKPKTSENWANLFLALGFFLPQRLGVKTDPKFSHAENLKIREKLKSLERILEEKA